MAYTEVLLREDIDNLGIRGQIVRVRRGYARNYLLPRGLAVESTAASLKQIDNEKRVLAKREAREKAIAEQSVRDLAGITLSFERKTAEEGRLFGSVTTLDIARALEAEGRAIDRHHIRLKDPIKQVGEYDVPVRLHREVSSTIKVVVTAEGGTPEAAGAPAEAATPAEAAEA